MAKTIKMCDLSEDVVANVFVMLNPGKVKYDKDESIIITDVEPEYLVYPEGWYYAKGTFRNKHTSTNGLYVEIEMIKSNGEFWEDYATYSTRRFN